MVFYCERAAGFADDVGLDDEGFLGALARMFGNALQILIGKPAQPPKDQAIILRVSRRIHAAHGHGFRAPRLCAG